MPPTGRRRAPNSSCSPRGRAVWPKRCTAKVAGKNWSGKYTFDEAQSKITMSGILINVNCYAKRNVDGIGLLFESSKLLSLLQTMSALSGNQTLQTIGELSKSYDGLRMGFDMKK